MLLTMPASTLHLLSFSDALLANILSFSDAADLLQVLECKNSILTHATRLALSNAPSLHLSYLLQLDQCRNYGKSSSNSNNSKSDKSGQEKCIEKLLLHSILQEHQHDGPDDTTHHYSKLQKIELSGLRHVVGERGDWLSRIFGHFSTTLTTVDFSGCALLDPRRLHEAIVPRRIDVSNNYNNNPSSCSIRHLNFQGCHRVDSGIVLAIAKSLRFRHLQHLGLGGCSQSIGNECVLAIVQNLKQLRSLDLSGLKRITDAASEVFLYLPGTLENLELAGCDLIRFSGLSGWGLSLVRHMQQQQQQEQQQQNNHGQQHRMAMSSVPGDFWKELHRNDKKEPNAFGNWVKMNFNGIGTPRRGLVEGALPYLALRSMGSLREVYLSGCEQVHDWEIEVLASVCANSLTCLEMRACSVGDDAIRAVGAHCTNIADLDFSACFRITDEGVITFCQYQGGYYNKNRAAYIPTSGSSCSVRSLKLGALPELTDKAILAISALDSLLVLDVHNCSKVASEALSEVLSDLTSLIELEATGIGQWASSIALRKGLEDGDIWTNRLRFINGRSCNKSATFCSDNTCYTQCSVQNQSKRLLRSQGVPLQPMFHCTDCKLTPTLNRGMCHACSLHCHQGHQTFVGSYTRFYCDCPFGIAGVRDCQAI